VELARETIAFVEAAGKEAPPRRARLRIVFDAAIDFFRAALRMATTGEAAADGEMAAALAGWVAGADEPATEAAALLRHTLDALGAIDRNANLTVLVDAWTAILEAPRLATSA
jgi:DNA polymerase-3 subunit delta'